MEWLMEVAVLVAKEGQPVTWVTPLGLPVMQPYRRSTGFQVTRTLTFKVPIPFDRRGD